MSPATTSNLTVTVSGDARARRLVVRGRLDESARLAEFVPDWTAREVVIDAAELGFINSIGIREWMHFIAALEAAGASLVFERCAEPLVEQMAFIPAVRGAGVVRSCFAPFVCERCGRDESVLIDIAAERAALEAGPPTARCPGCGEAMVFGDHPTRWRAFMRG